jgi:hypothetical protein
MLQETDNTVALAVSANPRTCEAKEVSVASSSVLMIDCFDAHEQEQEPAPHDASRREADRLAEIVDFTRKRERATRLIDPVEDSLYLLILAAALGYLLTAFLGL